MKRGALIYQSEDAERNAWFAHEICAAAERAAIELVLQVADVPQQLNCDGMDFAIARTRNAHINAHLESLGIKVFNNSATCAVSNDKLATYELCRELGISVLPTVTAARCLKDAPFAFPVVAKTRDGHGGKQVCSARNAAELAAIVGGEPERFIVQPFCSRPGVDVRVYLLGGRAVAAARRQSHGDFRSNYSLGGSAALVSPEPEMLASAQKLFERLGYDWIGADFLPHDGGWVLNELEDPVGARMLYSLSDIDVAKTLIEYIKDKI